MFKLPHWVLTDKNPAFYDTDSGSAIEQTARVYGAVKTFIEEYNTYVDNLNKALESFELETKEDIDCFKKCITELMETYIKSIDIAIDKQNLTIDKSIRQMQLSIVNHTTQLVNEALAEGKIHIVQSYDPDNESLDIIAEGSV